MGATVEDFFFLKKKVKKKKNTHQSEQEAQHASAGGVVGAVVEGRDVLHLPRVVALLEERPARGVEGADGLRGIKYIKNGIKIKSPRKNHFECR